MRKESRPLLSAGLILMIISYSIFFLGCVIIVSTDEFGDFLEEIYGLIVFFAIFAIVGVILSAISLSAVSKPYNIYKRRSGYGIVAAIMLAILTTLSFFGAIGQGLLVDVFFIYVVMTLGFVFTFVGHNKAKQAPSPMIVHGDYYEKIERFKQLRDEGIISQEEFQDLINKHINNN